ncbi:MAG: DUF6653 family protein [Pseudomonadota bacterium]
MADPFSWAENMMRMSDDDWLRHANRWSVYTRIPILPALALVWWLRDPLGWGTWVLTLAFILWAYWNPRAFPVPKRRDTWPALGTFGERVFLDRARRPIPRHHAAWAHGLTVVTALGLAPLVYGLWVYDIWAVLLGLVVSVGGKVWFVDRMVGLYRDMARDHQDLAAWSDPD